MPSHPTIREAIWDSSVGIDLDSYRQGLIFRSGYNFLRDASEFECLSHQVSTTRSTNLAFTYQYLCYNQGSGQSSTNICVCWGRWWFDLAKTATHISQPRQRRLEQDPKCQRHLWLRRCSPSPRVGTGTPFADLAAQDGIRGEVDNDQNQWGHVGTIVLKFVGKWLIYHFRMSDYINGTFLDEVNNGDSACHLQHLENNKPIPKAPFGFINVLLICV